MTQQVTSTANADGSRIQKLKDTVRVLNMFTFAVMSVAFFNLYYVVNTSPRHAEQYSELTAIRELIVSGIQELLLIAVAILLKLWANRDSTEILDLEKAHRKTVSPSPRRPHN